MSAKNPVLCRTGSHYLSDDISSDAVDGITKEEVYLYFTATWRGKPVVVGMSADRYSASFFNEATGESRNQLTKWRTYATEARYSDDPNTRSGDPVSGTARAALSKLCEPLVLEWLDSDAYAASFRTAVAQLIMRKFRDDYSASRRVSEALSTFRTRLSPTARDAIQRTLDAYVEYEAAKAHANQTIEQEKQ